MSKNKIRKDKTCLNCRHVVDLKFCSNCGQENTDTRKTFHHLFLHFFEDLTHYENAFWRTIKNLLFKPAALTKEYLSGKRLSYLAPVRLYIFISFITFFLIAVLPDGDDEHVIKIGDKTKNIEKKLTEENEKLEVSEKSIEELSKAGFLSAKQTDSIRKILDIDKEKGNGFSKLIEYSSIDEMDSIRKIDKNKISNLKYWINKKVITVNKNNTKSEIIEKAKESAFHNFPKALIIYMPLFAFFLWLFHSKKRWYYFDHGIFTLHYFSFLLLISLLFTVIDDLSFYAFGDNNFTNFFSGLIGFVTFAWMFYYFFPAHHRFYGESRWKSFFKSVILFFINIFFISVTLIIFFIYTLISIH